MYMISEITTYALRFSSIPAGWFVLDTTVCDNVCQ